MEGYVTRRDEDGTFYAENNTMTSWTSERVHRVWFCYEDVLRLMREADPGFYQLTFHGHLIGEATS